MYTTSAAATEERVPSPRDSNAGKGLDTKRRISFPEGQFFTIEAACFIFGIKARTLYNVISEEREKLDRPHYRRGPDNIRRRLLTERDISHLRTIFRIIVK